MTEVHKNWKAAVGMAILFCFLCAILLAVSAGLTKAVAPFYGAAIAFFSTVLLTLLFVGFNRSRMAAIGVLPTSRTGSLILIGVVIGLALAVSQMLVVLLAGHTSLVLSKELTGVSFISSFLLYAFLAAREEVAFRGYPLATLNKSIGPMGAQLIVAVLFILEHFAGGMNWWQAILGPGVGAILFGAAALRSNGIALPIGIHFAWNFGQYILGFKEHAGIFKTVIDPGYENQTEIVGWVGYVIVMGVGLAIVYRMKMKSAQH